MFGFERNISCVKLRLLISVSLLCAPCISFSAPDVDVKSVLEKYDERIKELESELKKQKEKFDGVMNEVVVNPSKSGKGRIDEIEKRLSSEEKKRKRSYKRLNDKLTDSIGRLKINGFASASIAYMDGDTDQDVFGEATFLDVGDDFDTRSDAVVGLQGDFSMNEKFKFTAQLLGVGGDNFNTSFSWAYVTYQPSQNLKLRAGRLRIPFYLASEYIDVGYAYPWVRPPYEMYSVPLENYEGFDIIYDFKVLGWNSYVQMLYGTAHQTDDLLQVEFTTDDLVGTQIYGTRGPWSARAGYYRAKLTLDYQSPTTIQLNDTLGALGLGSLAIDKGIGNFGSVGLAYDDGLWWAQAEARRLRLDGFSPKEHGGFVSVGRRFNRIMPFITWAKYYTTGEENVRVAASTLAGVAQLLAMSGDAAQAQGVAAASATLFRFIEEQQSISLAVRWDVSTNVAVKVDWKHFSKFDGTKGQFFGDVDSKADMFTLTIDTVF